jgi:hypothetical protein
LDALNQCDFFIAPPGVVIPFSHNIIEAMSVATIPITNYGHLFEPPLIDGVHCLSFSNEEELIKKVKQALEMDDAAKSDMRKNILTYYTNHLEPKAFAQKLLQLNAMKHIEYYSTSYTLQ